MSTALSQAKIDSNRRNAQKSTGPRTPEGKARAALNATVHGLYATRVASAEEAPEAPARIREQLIEEWRPASVLEVAMVDQIAELLWRRRRIAAVESTVLDAKKMKSRLGMMIDVRDDLTGMLCREMRSADSPVMRAQMYQMRLDRALHRALAELRRLQCDRRQRDEAPVTHADVFELETELETKNDGTNPPIAVSASPATS